VYDAACAETDGRDNLAVVGGNGADMALDNYYLVLARILGSKN
jgi:hypothetical protein